MPATTVSDAEGNTTEIRHYKGASPAPLTPYDSTKYTYTRAGKLETVTDAKGNVWRYTYDQLGRKKTSVDPDAGTTRTEYDELDRPVAAWDGRNKKTSTAYDALGRVTSTWTGDVDTGTKLTETRYDKAGWLGQAYAQLSYVTSTEYFASVVQSMDEFYQPLKTAYSVPASQGSLAGTYVFTSAYNRDGTVQSTGLPAAGGLSAEAVTYGYDALQRPTTMTGTTSYVTNTVYSKNSQLQQLELYAGSGKKVWQTLDYETGTDRVTRATVDVYGASAPAKQSSYSYDQAGNVLSIVDTANTSSPDVQCFAYDTQQRLTEAWTPASSAANAAGAGTVGSTAPVEGSRPNACTAAPGTSALGGPAPYWKSYETDAIGNRKSETIHDTGLNAAKNITRSYEYGGAGALGDGPHQLTKVTEQTPTGAKQYAYEFNDAGATTKRTIGGDAQSLEWDDAGRLTKVKEASGSETTYLYDASGSRIQRKDTSGTTVYLPGMELKLSADGTKKSATRYYSYAGQTVAVRTDDGKLSFVASDHHGTGELAIEAATGAISQRRFDPYGVQRGSATGVWPGEKGFVGGTVDASTGLTHLGAREYDSMIGKFISLDPVIDYTQPQQINGYAYANNSPVTLSDPSGLLSSTTCSLFPSALGCGTSDCGMLCAPGSEGAKVTEAQNEVNQAQKQQSSAKKRISSAGKELVKIVRDILGVDAALDCISTGDVGACGETLLNIAGSFAGGLAGKIMAKYGLPWKWAKGVKLAKRVVGLVGDLIGGVKDLLKANKALGKAKDGLAVARSKAADALRKLRKGKCHSFLPGTKVLLADGSSKPIEDVELGDMVTVTDPETGETTVREVAGTIVTEDDKTFSDLTVKTASGTEESLVATVTHPFWVVSEQAWIKAGDLEPGMTLRTPSGDTVELTANRHFDKRQRTHDLTITGIHTFYVLADVTPLLVHNCPTADAPDTSGTATVYLDAGANPKHASVKVEYDGKAIHSEQLGAPGTDAVGAYYEGEVSSLSFAIRIPLPNAKNAQAFQRATDGYVFDPYDLETQSCVTYCAAVLRAGGIGPADLPKGMKTDEVERWLLSKF
ncbi:RHS repeat-associated core domain-containing protein [Streptomyces sp. SS7]|uniref:RHS repeat-associated core domain-containing protein n=2 Tax=Streptomyces sp. SS7 TaxID=3108485 RepID=UPI0030EF4949